MPKTSRDRAIELYAIGAPLSTIAQMTGLSVQSIKRILGINMHPGRDPIINQRKTDAPIY
jgi:DNA invertase Pin-like site-specific DNA recombinase